MPWDFALILFMLGVVIPWRGARRFRQVLNRPALTSLERLSLYASTIAFQWVTTAVVAWRVWARRVPLVELGVGIPQGELTVTVTAGLVALLVTTQIFSLRRLAALPPARRGTLGSVAERLMPQNTIERLVFVGLAATAGLCEEFVYRGFVLAVLARAAGSSILVGVGASSLLFALAHFYQGPRGMVVTFFAGLLFAGVRVWTSSLAPAVIGHFAADLTAGMAARRMLRSTGGAAGNVGPGGAGILY